MADKLIADTTSSMHLAKYVGDELDDWLKQLVPLATDPAVKERLQKSLQLSAERRSRRARKSNI